MTDGGKSAIYSGHTETDFDSHVILVKVRVHSARIVRGIHIYVECVGINKLVSISDIVLGAAAACLRECPVNFQWAHFDGNRLLVSWT